MLPANTTTIAEFIRSGSTVSLDYDRFSFLETMENETVVSVLNVINDYIEELRNAAVLVHLDDAEYRKYVYKPKLLCYDIYGNPELYFVILLMNDMADVKEFNKRNVYMLTKDNMSMITSYIFNSEYKAIDHYNSKYT